MIKAALEKRVKRLEETTPEYDLSHVSDEVLDRHLFLDTKCIFGELTPEEMEEYVRTSEEVRKVKMTAEELIDENKWPEENHPELLAEEKALLEQSVEFTPELRSLLSKYLEI